MALTERQRFDRFVQRDAEKLSCDAYWWCSGKTWTGRRYCVVLVAKRGYMNTGLELSADTPEELAALVREAGFAAMANTCAQRCHAAPRSPRKPSELK